MTSQEEQTRAEGVIPIDDIVSKKKISENRWAYIDGNGTAHIGPAPSSTNAKGQVEREAAFSSIEAATLAEFLKSEYPVIEG